MAARAGDGTALGPALDLSLALDGDLATGAPSIGRVLTGMARAGIPAPLTGTPPPRGGGAGGASPGGLPSDELACALARVRVPAPPPPPGATGAAADATRGLPTATPSSPPSYVPGSGDLLNMYTACLGRGAIGGVRAGAAWRDIWLVLDEALHADDAASWGGRACVRGARGGRPGERGAGSVAADIDAAATLGSGGGGGAMDPARLALTPLEYDAVFASGGGHGTSFTRCARLRRRRCGRCVHV
jgi:hypothetical protein